MDTKIVDRVRKLLALANDKGATEAEASSAAAKAASIMEEHGIEMATLAMQGEVGEGRTKDGTSVSGLAREKWAETLMSAVAESCFVLAYSITQGGKLQGFDMFGRHSSVVSCRLMYEYLSRTVVRLSRREEGSQRHFRFGCGERIAQRLVTRHYEQLRRQRAEAEAKKAATPSNSTALVVVLQDYEQNEQDLNRDFQRGVAPGTTARERAEAIAAHEAHEARIQAIMKEHNVSWDIAWWMERGTTREEAFKRQESFGKASYERARDRVDFDARRRQSASYQRGRSAGEGVGLDVQVENNSAMSLTKK